jgi:hypothetical protein
MYRSEFEPTPDSRKLQILAAITNLESVSKMARLPKAAAPRLNAAIRDLRSLEGSCPCGTLKLYRVTHALPQNAEIFTRLIR